jgi:hypothetical protein
MKTHFPIPSIPEQTKMFASFMSITGAPDSLVKHFKKTGEINNQLWPMGKLLGITRPPTDMSTPC